MCSLPLNNCTNLINTDMFNFMNERNKTGSKLHIGGVTNCAFAVGDDVIAFNNTEWSNTGDLPEGNGKYYQNAKILKIRKSKDGESIADIIFTNGKKSNGHFLSTLELSTADKSKKALYIHSVSRCDPFG